LKFCRPLLRLAADSVAVDYIELYPYDGLIGVMTLDGDRFSYVNFLNQSCCGHSERGPKVRTDRESV
jgi:DUF1680 family protein